MIGDKPWWRSVGMWGGVLTTALSVASVAVPQLAPAIPVVQAATEFLGKPEVVGVATAVTGVMATVGRKRASSRIRPMRNQYRMFRR